MDGVTLEQVVDVEGHIVRENRCEWSAEGRVTDAIVFGSCQCASSWSSIMSGSNEDYSYLNFHPFFLILVRETLPVRMLLNPFFCRNGSCECRIELAECIVKFLRSSALCSMYQVLVSILTFKFHRL